MNKILSILVAVLLFSGTPCQAVVMIGFGQSAAAQAFSTGSVESFESASLDTTGWAETDTGGVITVADTTRGLCGSKSLKVISTPTTTGDSRLVNDFGADNDFYFAIHFWGGDTVNAYSENYLLKFAANSDGTNVVLGAKILKNAGYPYLRISSPLGDPSASYNIASTEWYRLEFHVVGGGGTGTIRLYVKNGAAWDIVNNSSAEQDTSVVGGNYTPRYLVIEDASDNGSSIFYLDAGKISLSAGTWLGGVTCP